MRPALLLLALGLTAAQPVPAGSPLPGDSLYHLHLDLTGADSAHREFSSLRGTPMLITMFYASCQGVCPTLAFAMRRMDAALTPPQRANLRVVMVSIDPEHDTPAALDEFAQLNQIKEPRWLLALTAEASMRELAAALGIRLRSLPGGGFSHSTVITLLDADGVPRARTSNLTELDGNFMRVLTATTSGGPRAASERR